MNFLYNTLIIFLIVNPIITSFAQKSGYLTVNLRTDLTMSRKGRLFAIDSVVDARLDTANIIGNWQNLNSTNSTLRLKDGFQPSLSNFVITSLPNPEQKLPTYTLIIHEFTMTGPPTTTRFELAVSFSKQESSLSKTDSVRTDQLPAPIYKAEIIVESNNITITEMLKQGLDAAFLRFNAYLANPSKTPSFYSDFAKEINRTAQEMSLTEPTYDVKLTEEDDLLRCQQFRAGVYRDFKDLRLNRPSLIGNLVVQEKKDFASLRKPSGSRPKRRFFGFSNGKDLFISTQLYMSNIYTQPYIKVKSIGRYLLWIDNYLTSNERSASTMVAMFGLVGGLVALASSSYQDCIALDMKTGGVFMVTKDRLPNMLAGHDDLLAEFDSLVNKKDEQEQFRLLDKLNQRMRSQSTK